jgi:hypothetical protein
MTQFTNVPIFDTDRHMCQTPKSHTQHPPEKCSHAVQFAPSGQRTHSVVNNKKREESWKFTVGIEDRGAYDFVGDNARRFTVRPIANPPTSVTNPPTLASA